MLLQTHVTTRCKQFNYILIVKNRNVTTKKHNKIAFKLQVNINRIIEKVNHCKGSTILLPTNTS